MRRTRHGWRASLGRAFPGWLCHQVVSRRHFACPTTQPKFARSSAMDLLAGSGNARMRMSCWCGAPGWTKRARFFSIYRAALLLVVLMGCGPAASPTPSPRPSPSAVAPSPDPTPTPEPVQRQEAALPMPVEETGAATTADALYVMGGFNAAGASLDTVYMFDGSPWRAGPRLPVAGDPPSGATPNRPVCPAGGATFRRAT